MTLLVALLAACGGAADGEPREGTPGGGAPAAAGPLAGQDCLVILLDALHAAHLGCYGSPVPTSPTLDGLAAGGVRLAHAWSNASWTLPSTATLFTGLYQETHGLHFGPGLEEKALASEATTLAELFDAAGYDTACWTQNPFSGDQFGLDQGFQQFHKVRGDRSLEVGLTMAQQVAERHRRGGQRPLFTYAHFRRPHTPFDPPADLVAAFADPAYRGGVEGTDEQIEAHNRKQQVLSPDDLAQHLALYRANVLQADRAVAAILEGVDLSRTLVLVLSDHGEAQAQHGRLGHNWHSFEEYVHVPMIFAHGELPAGRVVDGPASTVDVLPTLAELFGLEVSRLPLQGRSLVAALMGQAQAPTRPVFTSSRLDGQGRRYAAVREGPLKLLTQLPEGRSWLYDLDTDPGEQHDLSRERSADVERLLGLVRAWLAGQQERLAVTGHDGLDPEALEQLRALGYVGDQGGD